MNESLMWELAETFKCMVDSDKSIWLGRFDQLDVYSERNGREDLRRFVQLTRQKVINEIEVNESD